MAEKLPAAEVEGDDLYCFVISPIGEDGSEVRRRADDLLEFIIRPALTSLGIKPTRVKRADDLEEPGLISSQIVDAVINAPLVIADLTGHNANVFYELSLRHAIKKPVVQLLLRGERLPFDVVSQRTIFYDHRDLRLTELDTKPRLIRQVQAVLQDPSLTDNPIATAIDVQSLRQSNDPEANIVAEMAASMKELRSAVESLRRETRDTRLPGTKWTGAVMADELLVSANPSSYGIVVPRNYGLAAGSGGVQLTGGPAELKVNKLQDDTE